MIGCGTSTFTDPHDFSAPGVGLDVAFALAEAERFKAHLVWAILPSIRLLTIEEQAPRIAFLSLPPGATWKDSSDAYDLNEVAINWNGALIFAAAALTPPQ